MTADEKRMTHKYSYDKAAEKYFEMFGEDWDNIEETVDFCNSLPEEAKILDVGCGTAYLTDFFRKKGFDVLGIDYSESMLNIGRREYPNVSLEMMDMYDVAEKFDEDSFDAIHAVYSLMSIPKVQIDEVLQSFSKILKPDGNLFIILNYGKEEVFMDEPLIGDEGKDALFYNLYDEKKLFEVLSNNNFSVTSIKAKEVCEPGDPSNGTILVANARNVKIKEKKRRMYASNN